MASLVSRQVELPTARSHRDGHDLWPRLRRHVQATLAASSPQNFGVEQADERIGLVTFMHDDSSFLDEHIAEGESADGAAALATCFISRLPPGATERI